MAVEIERLVAVLEANLRKFEKSLDRASVKAGGTFKKIEKAGSTMEARLAAISPGFKRLLAPLAGAAGVRAFQTFSDAATRVTNSLKVAGLEGQALTDVQEQLYVSATKNAAPIEALVQLYGRAALAQKELNVTSQELLGFTDKVAIALKVSGRSAEESKGALLQLSQAIGSGIVRAEEFNSILEGALPIAQAAAVGLKEAGGSVAKLRTLIIAGKVSSEAFFRAFEAGAVTLEDKVKNVDLTAGQAFTNLQTALIKAAGKFNETTGASKTFAEGINALANVIAEFDVSPIVNGIGSIERALGNFGNSDLFVRLNKALGIDAAAVQKQFAGGAGTSGGVEAQVAATEKLLALQEAQRRKLVDLGFATTEVDAQIARTQTELAALAAQAMQGGQPSASAPAGGKAKTKVDAVSLNDFAPRGGSGGAGSSKIDAYQREINAIKARTEALQFEASILGTTAREAERLRTESELINAAQEAGIAITPELAGQIATLADAYAGAQAGLDEMEASQQRLIDQRAALADGLQSFASGFVSDLRQGVSAADALGKALDRLLDQLINAGINTLISSLLGGGLGGAPVNLLASPLKKAGGGIVSGPGTGRSDSIPAQLSNGEFVVNADATRRNRALLESINRGSRQVASSGGRGGGGSQGGHVTVGVAVDDAGAIQAYVARTTGAVVAENNRQTGPKLVKSAVGASGRKFGLQQPVRQR